jgi:spore coat polysaccharide biosynthesis predicted glycosyltransferase SpsG
MTREPVLFRVDGTRATGWEGLARCTVFANALQRRRRPCHFVAALEPATTLVSSIKRGDNQWIAAQAPVGTPEDLEQTIREIRRTRPIAVVVDSPLCSPDYLAELSALGPMVIALDVQGGGYRFPSQLVVHPLLNKEWAEYDVTPGTQVLAGKRYALVRPGIRRIRTIRGQEPQEPFRVVLAFGDDPHNWTEKMAKMLLAMPKLTRIDLLARSAHPHFAAWQALAEEHKGRITIASEVTEMAKRISRCHFAICEGNGMSLEMACVGIPMLTIVQDETYWATAQHLEEEGAAIHLGWHEAVTDRTIRMAVENMLDDAGERRMMSRCGRSLIDGRGPDRLVTALEILIYPNRRQNLLEAA